MGSLRTGVRPEDPADLYFEEVGGLSDGRREEGKEASPLPPTELPNRGSDATDDAVLLTDTCCIGKASKASGTGPDRPVAETARPRY